MMVRRLLCYLGTPITLLLSVVASPSVLAGPAAPTLNEPLGMVGQSFPTVYQWGESADSTWYRLWETDSSGEKFRAVWLKASDVCNIVGDGICEVTFPASDEILEGIHSWRVRGYDGSELGDWSKRGTYWDMLERPPATTLLEPLDATDLLTPTFRWAATPESIWFKLQVQDLSDGNIVNRWFRDGGPELECEDECSKTPMANITQDFKWRVRTYNQAGLGPWTDFEEVLIAPADNNPLGAVPNPVNLITGEASPTLEIFVTNNSSSVISGIYLLPAAGDALLTVSGGTSDIECATVVTELMPDQSCVITRSWSGNGEIGASQLMAVAGNGGVMPVTIEVVVSE